MGPNDYEQRLGPGSLSHTADGFQPVVGQAVSIVNYFGPDCGVVGKLYRKDHSQDEWVVKVVVEEGGEEEFIRVSESALQRVANTLGWTAELPVRD